MTSSPALTFFFSTLIAISTKKIVVEFEIELIILDGMGRQRKIYLAWSRIIINIETEQPYVELGVNGRESGGCRLTACGCIHGAGWPFSCVHSPQSYQKSRAVRTFAQWQISSTTGMIPLQPCTPDNACLCREEDWLTPPPCNLSRNAVSEPGN